MAKPGGNMANENTAALDSARKLQRSISLKVERQARTLEESRAELAGVEAYIRGLEKLSK